jgi:uncharacterized protein (TIGR03067 family)
LGASRHQNRLRSSIDAGNANSGAVARAAGATQDHTFWLVATKTPSRFDLSFESGIFSRGMTTYEGIYRIQGDRLEICVAHHPNTRPTHFGTDTDHEWRWLLVYRRIPPPKK